MPGARPRFKLGGPVVVESASEWHSNPIPLYKGEEYRLTLLGDHRFYAAFLPAPEYVRRRKAVAGMFNFVFGSDLTDFYRRAVVPEDDDYYLVIRVGGWTPKTTIEVRLQVFKPGES